MTRQRPRGTRQTAVLKPKSVHKAHATVYISTNSPISATLAKVDKQLKLGKVRVLALGRAAHQGLQVLAKLQHQKYNTKFYTLSVTNITEKCGSDGVPYMASESVPGIEIIVSK